MFVARYLYTLAVLSLALKSHEMVSFRILAPALVFAKLSIAMAIQPRATTIPAPYVLAPSQEWDGDDGDWSTFIISVGTPGQDFRVLISTASGETWVPVPSGCLAYPYDQTNCPDLRGVQPFGASSSPGFQNNQSSTWELIGIYDLGTEDNLRNYTGSNGEYGHDTVQLGSASDGSALSVDKQMVAGIATKAFYMGMLGVDFQPSSFSSEDQPDNSLLTNLYEQGQIPSLSYGYTAGAPYQEKGVLGNLVLGGYDSSRFTPSNLSFTFGSSSDRPLQVGVQSIVASDSLLGVASLTPSGTAHFSVIDSTVPELWLPQEVCDQFAAAFGLQYISTYDRYIVNTTMHNKLKSMNPTITIKLGNQVIDNGNSTNIELPYGAFDLTGSYPIFPNDTLYFPIRNASNDTQYTLGRTLLQEAYLVVDHDRGNFTLGQAIFSDPMPDSNVVTIFPGNYTRGPSNDDASGLSIGGIAGAAVGGAAGIILIVAATILFVRKKKQGEKAAELANTEPQKTQEGGESSAYADNEAKPIQELSGAGIVEIGEGDDPNKWSKERYAEDQRRYLLSEHGRGHGGSAPGSPGMPIEMGSDTPGTPGTGTMSSNQMLGLATPDMGQHHVYELPGEYYVPASSASNSREGSRRESSGARRTWAPTPLSPNMPRSPGASSRSPQPSPRSPLSNISGEQGR